MSRARRATVFVVAGGALLVACPHQHAKVEILSPLPITSDAPAPDADRQLIDPTDAARDELSDMVVLADGGILLAGHAVVGVDDAQVLVRLTADGTVDTTFGTGGVAVGARSRAHHVVGGAAGGIAVVTGSDELQVTRYDAAGSLVDEATALIALPVPTGRVATYVRIAEAATDSQGRVIVAGSLSTNLEEHVGGCCAIEPDTQPFIARLDTAGQADTSFDGDGFVVGEIREGESTAILDAAVTADDSILVLDDEGGLSRWGPDGIFDPSFGDDGTVATETAGVGAVALLANGDVFVAGGSLEGGTTIKRFAENGSPHPQGRSRGVTFDPPDGAELSVVDLAADDDGAVALAEVVERDADGFPRHTALAVLVAPIDRDASAPIILPTAGEHQADVVGISLGSSEITVGEVVSGDEDSRFGVIRLVR